MAQDNPPAGLGLSDQLGHNAKDGDTPRSDGSVQGDVRGLRQMLADCEQYLKEGEKLVVTYA